jgi:hypothetical protein
MDIPPASPNISDAEDTPNAMSEKDQSALNQATLNRVIQTHLKTTF